MKLTAALIATSIAASTCATAQANARSQRPPCRSYANTLIANSQVTVFRRLDDVYQRGILRRPAGFYACDRRSRRLRYLGDHEPDLGGGTSRIRLSGRYAAYEDRRCSKIECDASIVRVNARTGARRTLDEPTDSLGVLDLELTRRGIVVWIRSVASPTVQRFDVVRWDGTAVTVLDSGPTNEILRESLAISAGRAYWFARGQAMSAVVDQQ